MSHYGAHKAAIEKFVHSYGLGKGYSICALRPTGIYGITQSIENSKWFSLVQSVLEQPEVFCERGGKEVHASDVARAVEILLSASDIRGQSYNCYDMYVSEYEVASIAKELTGSDTSIVGKQASPKHQIDTRKIRELGMRFGGRDLLVDTVEEIIRHLKAQ